MNPKRFAATILLILSCYVTSFAQTSYRPEIFGALKTKFEVSTYDGDFLFTVRNSRLGVKGFAAPNLRYALQMELNSHGNFDVLDAYLAYNIGGLDISLGQQPYRFSTDHNRGAAGIFFANRSFIGKFTTRYYFTENEMSSVYRVADLGPRDIGLMLKYSLKGDFPMTFTAGILNGSGINNPSWRNHVNFIGRVDYGAGEGLGATASYYFGRSPVGTRMQMWNAELRYTDKKFLIEGEFAQRIGKEESRNVMTLALIQGLYRFSLPQNKFADHIAPLLRWDFGNNIKFIDQASQQFERFDGQRITVGLTFGLTEKILRSEIRFNYEHYFPKNRLNDIAVNRLFQNKFVIEFFATF